MNTLLALLWLVVCTENINSDVIHTVHLPVEMLYVCRILNLFNDDAGFQVTPNATVRSCAVLMTLKYFRNDSTDACLILKHWFTLPFGTGGMIFLGT